MSLAFTAGTTGRIITGSTSVLASATNMTLSMWVNLTQAAYNGTSNGGGDSWFFDHSISGVSSAGGGSMTAQIYVDLGVNVYEIDANWWTGGVGGWQLPGPSVGSWVHLLVTYSNSSTANIPTIYFNGVSQTITKTLATPSQIVQVQAQPIAIGNSNGTGAHALGNGALISDVAAWDVILGAGEIAGLVNGTRPSLIEPANLQLWVPCEGYLATETDSGINRLALTQTSSTRGGSSPPFSFVGPMPSFLDSVVVTPPTWVPPRVHPYVQAPIPWPYAAMNPPALRGLIQVYAANTTPTLTAATITSVVRPFSVQGDPPFGTASQQDQADFFIPKEYSWVTFEPPQQHRNTWFIAAVSSSTYVVNSTDRWPDSLVSPFPDPPSLQHFEYYQAPKFQNWAAGSNQVNKNINLIGQAATAVLRSFTDVISSTLTAPVAIASGVAGFTFSLTGNLAAISVSAAAPAFSQVSVNSFASPNLNSVSITSGLGSITLDKASVLTLVAVATTAAVPAVTVQISEFVNLTALASTAAARPFSQISAGNAANLSAVVINSAVAAPSASIRANMLPQSLETLDLSNPSLDGMTTSLDASANNPPTCSVAGFMNISVGVFTSLSAATSSAAATTFSSSLSKSLTSVAAIPSVSTFSSISINSITSVFLNVAAASASAAAFASEIDATLLSSVSTATHVAPLAQINVADLLSTISATAGASSFTFRIDGTVNLPSASISATAAQITAIPVSFFTSNLAAVTITSAVTAPSIEVDKALSTIISTAALKTFGVSQDFTFSSSSASGAVAPFTSTTTDTLVNLTPDVAAASAAVAGFSNFQPLPLDVVEAVTRLGTMIATTANPPPGPPPPPPGEVAVVLAAYPTAPEYHTNDKSHKALLARVINTAIAGKLNAVSVLLLTPNATSTTLNDPRLSGGSHVQLSPLTQSAAHAFNIGIWIESQVNGSCVIQHPSLPAVDLSFSVLIIG